MITFQKTYDLRTHLLSTLPSSKNKNTANTHTSISHCNWGNLKMDRGHHFTDMKVGNHYLKKTISLQDVMRNIMS